MNRSIALILATATIGLAAPVIADAQPRGYDHGSAARPLADLTAREDALTARIDRAERSHRLSRKEAFSLHNELGVIKHDQLRHRASGGVMTGNEIRDINVKLDRLSARIHDQAT
jgi:hypothetical protein